MYLETGGDRWSQFPDAVDLAPVPKASNRPSALGSTGSPLAGLALLTRSGAVLYRRRHSQGSTAPRCTSTWCHVSKRAARQRGQSPTRRVCRCGSLEPASRGPLGASSVTLDVTDAGQLGRIMFTTSAKQDGTFATVRATETVTSYGAPVTITVPLEKRADVRQRVGGHADEVLRPAAGTTARSVVQAHHQSPSSGQLRELRPWSPRRTA